jgi:lysophospholipase L1-like esterase
MTDTMGTNAPYLEVALKQYYPNIDFQIYNYGIGAQNILEGLKRFDSSYEYKDRAYPPLTELNPDVVVVESFSYNPIGESSDKKNEYQETLRNLIEKAKATGSKVVFMATIGPYKPAFGDGPGGVNWPDAQSWLQASLIENYLQTGLGVAKSSEVLVSDVYHQSLDSEGNGRRELVSTHDGIHPSVIGHQFLAAYLAHTLAESSLF